MGNAKVYEDPGLRGFGAWQGGGGLGNAEEAESVGVGVAVVELVQETLEGGIGWGDGGEKGGAGVELEIVGGAEDFGGRSALDV